MRSIGSAVSVAVFIYASNATADECKDVLSFAYDTDYSSGSTTASQALKFSICSHTSNSSANGAGLNINVPGYGSLGYSQDSDNKEFQAWCQSQSSNTFIQSKFQTAISKVNSAVISTWGQCMDRARPNVSLSYSADPAKLKATVSYRPDGLGPQTTAVKNVALDNLTCGDIANLKELGVRQHFDCIRPNPYAESSLTINLATVNSPDAVVIPPVPTPLVPKFTISGSKDMGDGTVHFSQNGSEVGWSYQNGAFTHSMNRLYYSPTQFIGKQVRVATNGCTVFMTILGTVLGDRSFYMNNYVSIDSPSHCDLPNGFQENIAPVNYSSTP